MALGLRDWVKEELDQLNPTDQVLTDSYIDTLIAKHRIVDQRRVYNHLNRDDRRGDWTRESRTLGGRVRITLTDLRGTKQHYGHGYTYFLHPDGFEVRVDDVVISAANYTFDPSTMTLSFTVPRAEADPVVTIAGHPVDMRAVLLGAANSLAMRIETLVEADGSNYRATAKAIRSGARQSFGSRIVRRTRG